MRHAQQHLFLRLIQPQHIHDLAVRCAVPPQHQAGAHMMRLINALHRGALAAIHNGNQTANARHAMLSSSLNEMISSSVSIGTGAAFRRRSPSVLTL